MSETKKANAISTAGTAEGLNMLASDASGSLRLIQSSALLSVSDKMITVDLDDMRTSGIYVLTDDCANQPVVGKGKILLVLTADKSTLYQIVLRGGDGGQMYFRSHASNAWQKWHRIV